MDNQFKPTHSGTPPEPVVDVRVSLTKTIWAFSTAMLGISIAMVDNVPFLPICVLAAAAVGTAVVWLGKGSGGQNPSRELAQTQEQLRQLEERLSHVETISRFERSLHERDALSGAAEMPLQSQQETRSASRPSNPISY